MAAAGVVSIGRLSLFAFTSTVGGRLSTEETEDSSNLSDCLPLSLGVLLRVLGTPTKADLKEFVHVERLLVTAA